MTLTSLLAGVVGAEHVAEDGGAVIVSPASAPELADIVRLAREHGFSLAPEGAQAGGVSAIVRFERMNRIPHISRENRSAVFGSGVTFGELVPEVEARGLILNLPLAPRASDSVVQSMLRREPVTMPKFHWDSADPLGCLEVVFGTGEIFRTGGAAGPGALEEQWAAGASQVEPSGPAAASWYRLIQGSFGTMGLVTWASARCEAKPAAQKPYLVTADDPSKIIDFMQRALYLRKGGECFMLDRVQLNALLKTDAAPSWAALINLTACELLPELRIQGESDDLRAIAGELGVKLSESIGPVTAEKLLFAARAPQKEPYWKNIPSGDWRELRFTCGRHDARRLSNAAVNLLKDGGFERVGVYIQPQAQGANWCCTLTIYCKPDEAARAEGAVLKATESLITLGAYFMTPCAANERAVMRQNESALPALRKIKEIVDPDHVLNPGKLCL